MGLVPMEAAASPPFNTESRGGNEQVGCSSPRPSLFIWAENLSQKFPAGFLSNLIDQKWHKTVL